jgi:hypothetical protein
MGRMFQSYREVMKFLLNFIPFNPSGRGEFENLVVNIKINIK